MRKKIVILGGGTGTSYLLRGLKDFPLDITAVITVSDNGRSTGALRKEFGIPGIGDIRKVISNLSGIDPQIKEMMEYRFHTTSDLNGHALGNLALIALLNITGSLKQSIALISKLLDVRHTVLPISEDSDLTLMAEDEEGNIVEGEANITAAKRQYNRIYYKEEPHVTPEVLEAIGDADLVIISMGSLYTSILPNLICHEVKEALKKTNAKVMYICNAVTQPGETDGFGVSDHIKLLNHYLGGEYIDAVIASNTKLDPEVAKKYETKEQKDPVFIDHVELSHMKVELLEEDLLEVVDGAIRHNSMKLAATIFYYLMRDESCHLLQL